MKKGLLSLLAVALTIVSCQNYDDQFAELTGLVNNLTTQVAGVAEVQNDLSALSTLVGTLSTSLGTVAAETAEIENIISGLASATTQIEALQDILDSGVASEADLLAVSEAVSATLAGVNTLLTKNASIQADLIIVDSETLLTAQELVLVGAQTPAKYILNGNATVDHSTLTAAEIVTANTLTAKLISITGATTVSGTVDLSGLTSLLGDYTIESGSRPTDSTITTIGGQFTLEGDMGAVTYPNLRHVEGDGSPVAVVINNEGEVTEIDFGAIATFGGTLNAGSFTSTKTTSVKTGAFVMTSIDVDNATTIDLDQESIAGLSIAADSADTINVNVATAATGVISVQATGTTNVFFNKLAASTGAINTTGANVAQFHIPALKASAGTLDINADIVAATALATIDGAADFTGTKSVDLTAVTAVTAELTVNTNPVNIPLAQFSGVAGELTSTSTTVIVGGVSDADMNELDPAAVTLTLISQDADVTLDATENANLKTFTATASGTGNVANLIVSAAPALTSMAVANFSTVTSAGNTTLVSSTLTGTTQDISFTGNSALKTLATNYITMLEPGNALNYSDGQEVRITGNALLKSVDLTTVGRLDDATITGNAVLASITAPDVSATTPLTGNAGGGAPGSADHVEFIVASNNVSVTYTASTAAVPAAGGTAAIAYGQMAITNASLASWKTYINSNNSVNSPTYSFDFVGYAIAGAGQGATTFAILSAADNTTGGTGDGTHAFAGTIDTAAELAICN